MTSSLRIKNFKNDKFGDFSSEIDFNTKMDIFRDVISLIINQCDPRRPKGVSASRAAQASEARLFIYIYICIYLCNELIEETAGHRKLIFGMWEYFGYGSSKF